MVSKQAHVLPDGREITKGVLYFGLVQYGLAQIVKWHNAFYDLQNPILSRNKETNEVVKGYPPILPKGLESVKGLEPADAAWALYDIINPVDIYQRTMQNLKALTPRNPDLGVVVEVVEERVNVLLDVAKEAPQDVLEATGLDKLLVAERVH